MSQYLINSRALKFEKKNCFISKFATANRNIKVFHYDFEYRLIYDYKLGEFITATIQSVKRKNDRRQFCF